jgi:transposase
MEKTKDSLRLDSKAISALPIINKFIDRIELKKLLLSYIPSKKNQKLSYVDAILIFVRNILLEREPLYKLSEWAAGFDPCLAGFGDMDLEILNDDRVGRSLDALFDADRASLLTNLVLKVVDEFSIELSQLHNDSTTVTVYGQYKNGRSKRSGKTSISLRRRHNKDYRQDLKQLLFTLTVSRDGAVPIHYKGYDGNITDDRTHIQTWEALRRITGKSDFIYVADAKLATRKQMTYITNEGGRFISVLPEIRKECGQFKSWIRSNNVEWQKLKVKPGGRSCGSDHQYWGYECPVPSEEGYRIIWILDSLKQDLDGQRRQSKIEKTIKALDTLKGKVGTRKWKSKKQIEEAVEDIFTKYRSGRFFDWKMVAKEVKTYKQKKKGRPSSDTEYVKIVKSRWTFEAMPNGIKIQEDAAADGVFALITNIEASDLLMAEILDKYKFQPYIEKRHQQFKSVFEAAPVFLKLPHRIEALMFVYFIVLTLNALIERELRLAMASEGIRSLPLYPENRRCKYPTTARIIDLFSNLRRHVLFDGGKEIKCFYDPISELQEQILDLFNVSKDNYTG